MRPGTLIAAIIFALVAVGHASRLASGWRLTIGTNEIPMWISVVAVVVSLALAAVLVKESGVLTRKPSR